MFNLGETKKSKSTEGFENLKPSTEYDALYEAALCRERADWIVGINAGIIEKLVRITVIPELIQSPIMTAEWEQKLVDIEDGNYSPEDFMSEIEQMISGLIDTYEVVKDAEVMMKPVHEPVGKCPACGADVVEKSKGFMCSNRDCKFALWKENRFMDALSKKMTKQIAVTLLKEGRCKLKKCRSVKTGKTYDTTLVLSTEDNGRVNFSLDFSKKG